MTGSDADKDLHGYALDYRTALHPNEVEAAWQALSNFVFGEKLHERSVGFKNGWDAATPELLEALRELHEAETAPFPSFFAATSEAQEAWSERKAAAHERALAAIAKAGR